MTAHTLEALAILAPAIVTAWICRPRRRPAFKRTLRLELASIRRAYDCRGKLVHLGRPEILAILNARDDGRERREISDLAARALRLERCLQVKAQRTTAPIGRAARRRRRRRSAASVRKRYTTFARAISWLGLLVARALERGSHLWH